MSSAGDRAMSILCAVVPCTSVFFIASGSRTAVLAAISGNALLTVLKFGAAFVGHSASMMNEAIHSLVDTLNQVFLYLGLHFGSRPPDRQYAFGHGQKSICGTYGALSACSQSDADWVWPMPGMHGRNWTSRHCQGSCCSPGLGPSMLSGCRWLCS